MSSVDEVRQKADIADVVASYGVKLEKMGRNLKALCPFHSEKHASFFVFPDQQRWHCFGACATGGDVFSFVMKREGIEFGQALQVLAERAGVAIKPRAKEEDSARDRLHQLNAAAADYYHHLLTSTREGEATLRYLQGRGVTSPSIEAFQLGFSADSWDALGSQLKSQGATERDLLDAGLAVKREHAAGSYDRFRGRLMFPIRDSQGRVTGFGARALDQSEPKYINSPQTLVFDKSSVLYGIDRARAAIRRENHAVIVEGYMDVILAHQCGFENVVASMGTALTERQVNVLKKLTKRLCLALDADAAGAQATLRGLDTLDRSVDKRVVPLPDYRGLVTYETEWDAEVTVAVLPQGKDPDELVLEAPDEWKRLVQNVLPVMDFILAATASRADLKTPGGRSQMANQVLPSIAAVRDPVKRSEYLQRLAHLVNVDAGALADAMRERRAAMARRGSGRTPAPVRPGAFSNPVEDYCLALLLQNAELKDSCEGLSPDYFDDSATREVLARWMESDSVEALSASLDPSLHDALQRLLAMRLPPANSNELRHHLSDTILALRERRLRSLERRREMLLREASAAGAEAEIQALQKDAGVSEELREIFRRPKGKRTLRPTEGQRP